MKSAYEIAMSRLEAKEPTVKLTATKKAELAEIDSLYESRIAERRVFLEGEIRKADAIEAEDLRRQLASEIARLEEEREDKKGKARGA
jgi:nitroimidazol reductase NimA-like FMN-containing flavoprotein (pyridoxamine 5'-phosphate oxidase superfamily)